jgi:hypothetical protein
MRTLTPKPPREKRKKMNAKLIPTEEQEQLALADLLNQLKLTWFHPANEGMRKPQYAAKQKRLGLKAGIPDVIILDVPPKFPESRGAVIELKRQKGGRLSNDQRVWLQLFQLYKWQAAVCKGIDEAIEQLREWGYMK